MKVYVDEKKPDVVPVKQDLVPERDSVEVVDDEETPEDLDNRFSCIEPSWHDEAHEGEGDEKAEADDAIMDTVGLPNQKKADEKAEADDAIRRRLLQKNCQAWS
eukprot:1032917-Amphidinium_carterae.1